MEHSQNIATPGSQAAYDVFNGTPYRTLRRIGAGGMGEVFLVEHRRTSRELVAKLIHEKLATDPRFVERLRIEAEALGQLDHPNLVKVVGFDKTQNGRSFIVMESLRGRTLSKELASAEGISVLDALTYACQVLSALGAAHELGLVHRDIKPDNLFVCSDASGVRSVKLLDFGVARVTPAATAIVPLPAALATEVGAVLGTPRFASPEGATGGSIDARADLYATGLVLYLMLAGRGPFDDEQGAGRLLSAHARRAPDPPSRFAKTPIPPELDRAVLKALEKDPDARFQTAGEFRALLEQTLKLLRSPTGWLETTVFYVGSSSGESSPIPNLSPSVLIASEPSIARVQAVHAHRESNDSPSPAEHAARNHARQRSWLAETGLTFPATTALFLIAMTLAGLAAVGLVSVFQGP
jgi:serine/threonine-protein kinase